jgi:hypothetical protein
MTDCCSREREIKMKTRPLNIACFAVNYKIIDEKEEAGHG